jgi:ribosomal protein S27E
MSNFLDMRCPKCGDEDRLDIQATVWIRVCEDGTDVDAAGDGNHEYEPRSPAQCGTCGHCGTVRAFEQAGGAS